MKLKLKMFILISIKKYLILLTILLSQDVMLNALFVCKIKDETATLPIK